MGAEEYGLTVGIHAHAAGFMDFEPELERLLDEVPRYPEDLLRHRPSLLCGFDPVAFMKRHIGRISYMHFKDIDPVVKADVIAKGTGFYDACGQGIFCNLGRATWISPPCARSCWMPVSRAGARWSRIATRRSMSRPSTTRGQPRLSAIHRVLGGLAMARLNWGMIGGGEGSQIGPAHRLGAQADGNFVLVAGALDVDAEKAAPMRRTLGVAPDRAYGDWREMLEGERNRPIASISSRSPRPTPPISRSPRRS
jgi:hypothetical protein